MRTLPLPLENPTPDRRIGRRLFGFVLVSMLLHTVVLFSQRSTMELESAAGTTMRITLGEIKKITTTPTQQPAPRPLQRQGHKGGEPRLNRPAPASMVEGKTTSSEPPAAEPAPEANPLTLQESGTTTRGSAAEAAATAITQEQHITLSHLLKLALAKQFHYPMLARKRGWQGEVLLAFTLDTSGTITDARIARGSGYSALDRAALNSLARVSGLGIPLSGQLRFELPVIYSLSGG